MKIIPAVDLMDGKVVRLVQGDPNKKKIYSDNPIQIAKKWENSGADMIHLVDLDATLGRGSNLDQIKKIVENISIPVEVAGGLRDKTKIENVLKFAPRVVLGTIAVENKDVLRNLLTEYGKDRIVISADHKDGTIMIDGWKKSTGINLVEGLNTFIQMGFSEFLLTNVGRDGTLQGPDLEFLRQACSLNVNVISSGGISSIQDVNSVRDCKADGVILGKALYEGLISIQEAKKVL